MLKCAGAEVSVLGVAEKNQPKQNCIQIRGKLTIKVNNKQRAVGFKFICPIGYPQAPPYVFLDEKLDRSVIDFVDYVEENNRIMCDMLQEWQRSFDSQKHHLIATLQEVYRLYTKMPPVPIEEA